MWWLRHVVCRNTHPTVTNSCQFALARTRPTRFGQDRGVTPRSYRRGPAEPNQPQEDRHWFAPCPMGFPKRPSPCLGYYESEPGRLQVRFLARDDEGVCDILVEESAAQVILRLFLCRGVEPSGYFGMAEEHEHVYLEEPLGDRVVLDFETAEPMALYVPTWWNNRQTKAPGFYTDPVEAREAWELLPEGVDREGPPVPWRMRTLGY